MEIKSDIQLFIQQELIAEKGNGSLDENHNLIEEGIIDSMGIVKLLTFIKNTYDVKVGDDELVPDNFESIQTITNMINQKLSN